MANSPQRRMLCRIHMQVHYENRELVTFTKRTLRPLFGGNNAPSERAVHDPVRKFETAAMLIDKLRVLY